MTTNTRVISALLEIMSNEEISTRRRIEPAEGLLAYCEAVFGEHTVDEPLWCSYAFGGD